MWDSKSKFAYEKRRAIFPFILPIISQSQLTSQRSGLRMRGLPLEGLAFCWN